MRFQFSFDNILMFLFVVILATLLLALNSQPLSAQAESDVICGRVVEATACERLTSTLRVALQRCDGGPPLLLPGTNIGDLGASMEIHGPKLRPVEKFYCSNEHGFLLEELFEATSATLVDSCPATCTDDVLQENKKHRHIIFLGGINSASSATLASPDEEPINGDFDRIRDALKKAGFGQFAYFSYSARAKPQYCMGWEGGESGKCPASGDLTELSAYPVYDTNDTHQDIIEQAAVLNWLIGQIIQRDPQARIDLIGFSLGGVVASYWASQNGVSSLDHDTYHDNIHSIILINSPVGGFAVAEPFLNCSGDVLDKIKCEIWSHILREGLPRDIMFPGFGQKVLTQLQDPTDNTSASIVDDLPQAAGNYPRLVSIQSTADYMVNGRSLTLCRAVVSCGLGSADTIIGIGTQSLYWPPSAISKKAELGGRGIPTGPIDLEQFPGLLRENHNAALAHPQTAAWVVQAVEPAKTDVIPVSGGFGPESVWEPSLDGEAAISSCINQPSDRQFCLIDTMRRFGAPPQAVALAEQIGNEGYLADFQDIGTVDLGVITYPLAANSNFGNPVLLNGVPPIIVVNDHITEDELSGNLAIQNDPVYSSLASQFPEIMRDTTSSFEIAQQLSSGGQRFSFRSLLLNGCRACDQLGIAHIAFDFDETGKSLGTKLLSIELLSKETQAPLPAPPQATTTEDGKVYLGDSLLLDTQREVPSCSGVGEISYSPTADYFLVLLQCHEGDNEAFIFRADGSDKRRLTDEWDYINYDDYEWSPDGTYLIYQRINSCCAPIPVNVPPAGRVRYDVRTGIKIFLDSAANQPPSATAIIENGDGSYSLDGDPNCVERMLNETPAAVVVWGGDANYCLGITEGEHRGKVLGELQFATEIYYELNGNEFMLCDYENCIHAYKPNVHHIHGIVQGICDFYVNRSRQTPSCTTSPSMAQPEIISNDLVSCRNAKGSFPLVVSAVEDSPWCLIYPEGDWGGTEFDKFVLNGQSWTWLRAGCEYRLNDDSGDEELKVNSSPKVVRGLVGTVDYVIVSCN